MSSPPNKKIKLDDALAAQLTAEAGQEDEEDIDQCSICLQDIMNRTIIPPCSHEFCFECLVIWSEKSRRCPLCSGSLGDHLIHSIRSRYDYRKYFLPPLRTSPEPLRPLHITAPRQQAQSRSRRRRTWGSDQTNRFDRSVIKRKWVYEHGLLAKHVASNSYTRYRPYPLPAQFANSPEMISRATAFLRRELLVWPSLDIEFLTSFTVSLMKSIDIRSEAAVKLLGEFLDMDSEERKCAEHFAHEVYSYLRSPFKDLFVYDSAVQYDIPGHIQPPTEYQRSDARRWDHPEAGPSSAQQRGRSRQRSRSHSRTHSRHRHHHSGRLYSSRSPGRGTSNHRRNPSSSSRHSSPRRRSRSISWSPHGNRHRRAAGSEPAPSRHANAREQTSNASAFPPGSPIPPRQEDISRQGQEDAELTTEILAPATTSALGLAADKGKQRAQESGTNGRTGELSNPNNNSNSAARLQPRHTLMERLAVEVLEAPLEPELHTPVQELSVKGAAARQQQTRSAPAESQRVVSQKEARPSRLFASALTNTKLKAFPPNTEPADETDAHSKGVIMNDDNIPPQVATDVTNRRAELLAKLKSEKNLATTTTRATEGNIDKGAEKEKQLRMKARLQQRLAAEKRQADQGGGA